MMEILSANTIIYCKHWQETRHFYTSILGLKARFKKDDWFIEFAISEQCCLSIADASRCSINSSQGEGITLSFRVESLLKHFLSFKEQGCVPTRICENSWRAPFFFIRDPENTRIEFWTLNSGESN